MANIAALLCLTGLLAAALAHGTGKRQEITRGRSLNTVDHRHPNAVTGGGLGMLHNHHPHPQPHPHPHHNPHPQHGSPRRGGAHHGRGGRHHGIQAPRGGQGMHRMMQHHNLLKASQQVIGRQPSHRMMQTLREELSRYHHLQQMAARHHGQGHRGQGHDGQGHRSQGHDGQGHRSQGHGQSVHQWMLEMGRSARGPHHAAGLRVHSRHHLGNDRRGQGHLKGDPHAIRVGHHGAGHNHRGHGMGPSYGVL
ncbi:hypothetical protein ACOMHN_045753 [Nucella lapillus]